MSMTVPNFIQLEYDEPNRKALVSVEDKQVKKQREMWGMFPESFMNDMGIVSN